VNQAPVLDAKRFNNFKMPQMQIINQGSDTWVRTQKNPVGFFGYTHLKNPPPKKTQTSTLT